MDSSSTDSEDAPALKAKGDMPSIKNSDDLLKAKRGPYKRYLHHDSASKIPGSTKRTWNVKRRFLSNEQSALEPSTSSLASTLQETDNNESSSDLESEYRTTELDKEVGINIRGISDDGPIDDDESTTTMDHNISLETTPREEMDETEVLLDSKKYSEDDMVKTLLVLATKLRHNLTYEAAADIVQLISVMSDVPFAQGSKYYWKNIIRDFSSCLTVHHICNECGQYVGVESDEGLQCTYCGIVIDAKTNLKTNNAFMYISLTYLLREMFELTTAHEKCQKKRKKQTECAIEDIFDGRLYKELQIEGMVTINFSVDGVPVFDSSHMSMHPVLCTVNELNPRSRGSHVLLCGLWFGKGKPNMNEYLKPFVNDAQILYTDGFTYKYEGVTYTRKCRVLAGVCDTIARPMLRNSIQFNGKYGCGLCLHSGEVINKGRGTTRVYPLGPEENPWGEGLRTLEETLQNAEAKVKGMKGRSILCDIPGFNIVNSLDVDWMHAVAPGVCRQFAKLWFDSSHHDEDFYFGHLIGEVDALLLSYTPTAEVSRTPRKMSDLVHWKAHEWVIFLLFYSLPTLDALIPKKYVNHWALLVYAIQMLSQTSIMRSEIVLAHRSLIQFIDGVEQLYGRQYVSLNVHLLSHLGQSVEMLGPLWTHSAFVYENANQLLLSYIKSSQGGALQICDTFRTKCVVDRLNSICKKKMTTAQKEYLEKILKKGSKPKPSLLHADACMLGAVTAFEKLSRPHKLAFERANINITPEMCIESYKRAIINGEIVHSEAYTLVEKRHNYYVRLIDDEIFSIKLFYVLKEGNNVSCFAIGNYFEKDSNPLIRGRKLKHLIPLKKCTLDLAIIKLTMVKDKVTVLAIRHSQLSLACVHPNHYELLT